MKTIEHVHKDNETTPIFTVAWENEGPFPGVMFTAYAVAHGGYDNVAEPHYMPAENGVAAGSGFTNNIQQAEMYLQGQIKYDGTMYIDQIENRISGEIGVENHYQLLKYLLDRGLFKYKEAKQA